MKVDKTMVLGIIITFIIIFIIGIFTLDSLMYQKYGGSLGTYQLSDGKIIQCKYVYKSRGLFNANLYFDFDLCSDNREYPSQQSIIVIKPIETQRFTIFKLEQIMNQKKRF